MKRIRNIFAAALAVLLAVSCLAPAAFADIKGKDYVGSITVSDRDLTVSEVPTINAKYGILCDGDGNVLWSRSADTKSAMASITKIMTAVVVLENANLDDVYTVSQNAASVGESSIGVQVGDQISVYNLLCGLLIHSGNDAGVVLAEGVAGSIPNFVEMMNAKAAELGLKNTHYDNPHGLDSDDHYSTANDICVLSRYAMQNKTFAKIVGKKKVTVDYGNRKATFRSTNSLLNMWDPCIGVKTGYTGNAGYCLSSAAEQDGVRLYAVVLGCADQTQRFTDSLRLLSWGFKHYRTTTLATADEVLADVPVSAYTNRTVPAGVAEDISLPVLDYDGDISIDVALVDLPDGVEKGGRVGTITWRQGEKALASAPLVAKEGCGKPFAIVSVWTSVVRLVGWFTGDDAVADTQLHTDTIAVDYKSNANGETVDEALEEAIRKDSLKA